jgi:hypothetical protein
MASQPSLQTIRTKKRELLAAAARYEELAAKARSEAMEFETAERVWLRLFGPFDDEQETTDTISQMTEAERRQNGADAIDVRRKPEGIPPVPEMILEALKEAEGEGKPGLAPQSLLAYVRNKYWPEAGNSDIGSTAWRMWKDGRLAKPDENSSVYGIARHREDTAWTDARTSSSKEETEAVGAASVNIDVQH